VKYLHMLWAGSLMVLILSGCATSNAGRGDARSAQNADDGELVELVETARQDYNAGRYSAARQKLERALEDLPRDGGLHTRAANAAYQEGRYRMAAKHYEQALQYSDSPLPRVRYNLAMVRLTQAAAELSYLQRTQGGDALRESMGGLLEALERHTGRPAPTGLATQGGDSDGD